MADPQIRVICDGEGIHTVPARPRAANSLSLALAYTMLTKKNPDATSTTDAPDDTSMNQLR